jgi:hypothetical protein
MHIRVRGGKGGRDKREKQQRGQCVAMRQIHQVNRGATNIRRFPPLPTACKCGASGSDKKTSGIILAIFGKRRKSASSYKAIQRLDSE